MPPSKATNIRESRPGSRQPRYRFVGGKGGVGKTTCAAALGLLSARSGRRTLIISTDPAPSLGDAFRQPLGARPRPIAGIRGLDAVEVNASAALASWLRPRQVTLEMIALRGTLLDQDDVSRLLRLSLPGIDEIAGLLQITGYGEQGRYDRIIVDTAPTGHLLRMLDMPAALQRLAQVFDRMQAKHRVMAQALRGAWTPDQADGLIEEIGRQAGAMLALLRDRDSTALAWVTLPEPMSLAESADGVGWLHSHGVRVDSVILNRMTPVPPEPCRWCQARRRLEHRTVTLLRHTPVLRGIPVRIVPATAPEPRGLVSLSALARVLESPVREPAPVRRARRRRTVATLPVTGALQAAAISTPGTRLVMFGGKGGVGKTTCAAAEAIEAAGSGLGSRVLLLSTDPAHSLADVLGQPCADEPRSIPAGPSNLVVRELDAARVFSGIRARFASVADALFRRLTGHSDVDASHDRQILQDLFELAPPGADEIAAILEVTESLVSDGARPGVDPAQYDLVVMDTAPTGHALRLLEMPSLVHDWVRAIMSILLKYQPAVGLGESAAELVRLSQRLTRLRDLLSDPVRTKFVVVTRPGALPRAETIRLAARLVRDRINTPVVIVNAAGNGTCSRCVREQRHQRSEIRSLRKALAAVPRIQRRMLLAPAEIPAPHGPRALRAWHRSWQQLPDASRQRTNGR